jgi:hypothetical protein
LQEGRSYRQELKSFYPGSLSIQGRGRWFDPHQGEEARPRAKLHNEKFVAERLVVVPDAAFPTFATHGSGWRCKYGFRRAGEACQKVMLPENAYPVETTRGRGWQCGRGFQRSGETCKRMRLPRNAFLKPGGREWECIRGYRRSGEQCQRLILPENSHLGYSGHSWACDRGFILTDGRCVVASGSEHGPASTDGNR